MFITAKDGSRIAAELKNTIGRDVNIMDNNGTIIASTDTARIGQQHSIAQRIIRENLPVLEVRESREGDVQEGINLPIHLDDVCEGVIGITGPADAVRDFGTLAKKMTEILLKSLRAQEQHSLLTRARNLFIEEWLFADDIDWTAFSLRGELLGIETNLPRRIALLEFVGNTEEDGSRLLQLAEKHLRDDERTLWAVVNRRLLVLFHSSGREDVYGWLERLRRDSTTLTLAGGVSTPSRDAADLRRCYTEAKIAARAAVQDGMIREYSSTSLDFLLYSVAPKVKRDLLSATFPPMEEAAREELIDCLRLYFRHEGNVEAAAAEACVHKNTFRYRMEKIRAVTGYDLRKPRDIVMLYIALHFFEEHGI